MSSQKIEAFSLYNESTGAPLTGATPTFDTYKDDLGTNLSQPAISEIGGGFYKFTPDITTDPARGIVYIVNGGAGSSPRRQSRLIRPEDFAVDQIPDIYAMEFGEWRIFDSGLDANRMVTYYPGGLTVLKKFDLKDVAGSATTVNPFRRIPI